MPHSHCAAKRQAVGQIANATLKKWAATRQGGVQDLERLVIGPGSSRLVSNAALFKQVERKAGERSQGRVCNVDVTHLKSEQTDVCDTAAVALRLTEL